MVGTLLQAGFKLGHARFQRPDPRGLLLDGGKELDDHVLHDEGRVLPGGRVQRKPFWKRQSVGHRLLPWLMNGPTAGVSAAVVIAKALSKDQCLMNGIPLRVIFTGYPLNNYDVTIQWAGGVISAHRLRRPVARYDQLSNVTTLLARINGLRQAGHSFAQIAAHLNRDGFYPPQRADQFSGSLVARLLSLRGLHGPRPRTMVDTTVLQPYEYWLTDFARTMNMPMATVHKWQRLGWVHRRKVAVAAGRWAIWADDHELARLRRLRAYQRQWPEPRYPAALTTPTPRDDARPTAPSGITVPRA